MPLPLAAIGLGVDLVSKLGGSALFGDEQSQRFNDMMAALKRYRSNDVLRAAKAGRGQMDNSRQAAAARAAASGRPQDLESMIIPAEGQAADQANTRIDNINSEYDQRELNLRGDYANRPIQPNFLDYLGKAAGTGTEYLLAKQKAEGSANIPGLSDSSPASQGIPTNEAYEPGGTNDDLLAFKQLMGRFS